MLSSSVMKFTFLGDVMKSLISRALISLLFIQVISIVCPAQKAFSAEDQACIADLAGGELLNSSLLADCYDYREECFDALTSRGLLNLSACNSHTLEFNLTP